jgi:hypothetical protein
MKHGDAVRNFYRTCWWIVAFVCAAVAAETGQAVEPLLNAHAHNDYLHKRPLFDALDHGFTSVEADVFLVGGKLLVAHEEKSIKPERTLEELYLEPLAERMERNRGRIYRDGPRFILLIDLKSEPRATYAALEDLLSKYRHVLTGVVGDEVREGAVTVVVTGGRVNLGPLHVGWRLAGQDGTPDDLESDLPAHYMPMISDKWSKQFTWKGEGEMPANEREKLRAMAEKAHARGRMLRFWETPEKEEVWEELKTAGVDLINTDQLIRLELFLNGGKE